MVKTTTENTKITHSFNKILPNVVTFNVKGKINTDDIETVKLDYKRLKNDLINVIYNLHSDNVDKEKSSLIVKCKKNILFKKSKTMFNTSVVLYTKNSVNTSEIKSQIGQCITSNNFYLT